MHLRSLTLKGFKSFPNRTRLEFDPGVAVIIGPNGSGKSNITDAVLWAMGEQSPLAVRGQSMQDVIFAGGKGMQARSAAEVELVLDNADGAIDLPVGEISIVRRLDRSGDGEYRLNGARCRLVDVLEVLSDTGLGKEMHSVVSQGRVEAIVHSKPRDRRLLIEEAAGLGKHRKRRRRAQLKLERTEDNIARVLDVEREARSRLRPLKRQAEAAELHERLERQSLDARLELARDAAGSAARELALAESEATSARERLSGAERLLAAVAERRERAEEEFAEHSRRREAISGRLFAARSAEERISMRLERAVETAARSSEAVARLRRERGAIAAALGPLLRAGVADDIVEAGRLLDGAGPDGGSAVVAASREQAPSTGLPPVPGARRMLDLIHPAPQVAAAVRRLLANAWLVPSLDALPDGFDGIAATAGGRVYFGSTGELRQAPATGEGRLLEERSRRERLVAAAAEAQQAEAAAREAADAAQRAVALGYEARDRAEGALRAATRQRDEAAEAVRRADWLMERRRQAPAEGHAAVRRAEIAAELKAERLLAEHAERARAERGRRLAGLAAQAHAEGE